MPTRRLRIDHPSLPPVKPSCNVSLTRSRKPMRFLALPVCAAALAVTLTLPTFRASAQDDAPPPPPPGANAPRPPEGGPGGGDFRQRMNERLKTALKASDEEWGVIQPLLEKVQDKQRDAMTNRFGGMMRGGGGERGGDREGGRRRERGGDNNNNNAQANAQGGDNNNRGDNNRGGGDRPRRDWRPATSPEGEALTSTLQNDNASVNDIKTKLAALREQRKKSTAELETAREDLKKVLNMRQEAVLVLAGMLD